MPAALYARESIEWLPAVKVEKYSPDQVAYAAARLLEGSSRLTRYGRQARRTLRQHSGPPGFVLRKYCQAPEEGVAESIGNSLLYMGMNKLDNWLIAAGGTNNGMGIGGPGVTHGYVGVGDSSTVPTPSTDTAMLAAVNHCYNSMDAGFPTIGTLANTGILTVQSTFAPAAGVFTWNEWGCGTSTATVAAATTSANAQPTTGTLDGLFNRAVVGGSLGTKGSGSAWVFTVTLRLQ